MAKSKPLDEDIKGTVYPEFPETVYLVYDHYHGFPAFREIGKGDMRYLDNGQEIGVYHLVHMGKMNISIKMEDA